jgi:hypothetical protein
MGLPRLYLNQDQGLDWLSALEYGRVDDGDLEANDRPARPIAEVAEVV